MKLLKEKLECKLTLAKVKECLGLSLAIKAELEEAEHDSAYSLILRRAFRAIILSNKVIAKELLSCIPKEPTYKPRVNYRPNNDRRGHNCEDDYVSRRHNNNYRENNNDRRHNRLSDRINSSPPRWILLDSDMNARTISEMTDMMHAGIHEENPMTITVIEPIRMMKISPDMTDTTHKRSRDMNQTMTRFLNIHGGLLQETDGGLNIKRRLFGRTKSIKRKNRRKAIRNSNIINNNVVINLSSHVLSIAELSIINKGLGFVPTHLKPKFKTNNDDILRFERKLQLHFYFNISKIDIPMILLMMILILLLNLC